MSISEALMVMNFKREDVNATSLSEVGFIFHFILFHSIDIDIDIMGVVINSVLNNTLVLMILSMEALFTCNQKYIVLTKLC